LNRNEIVRLNGRGNDIENELFIGKPIGTIYGYKINGIYQLDDDIPAGFRAGGYRFVDTNKNGKIGNKDRIILGYTVPSYSISFSNSVKFKNFSFNLLISTIQGGDKYYKG